jgi:hypothetical protein
LLLLPHSALSCYLSLAEDLASLSLHWITLKGDDVSDFY